MGIDLRRMMLLSFGLAALIGSVGGVLVAPIMSLQFDSGQFFTIAGFIAVAIGGMGSFAGSIVGGLLLGVAEQFAAFYVSSLFANTLLAGAVAVGFDHPAGRPVSKRPAAPQRCPRRCPRIQRRAIRLDGYRAVILGGCLCRASCAPAGACSADRHAVVTGHFTYSVYRRARARRADGLCGSGQSRSGRLHGGRWLCRGDSGDVLRLAAACRYAGRDRPLRALRAHSLCRHGAAARPLSRAGHASVRAFDRFRRRRTGRSDRRTLGSRWHSRLRVAGFAFDTPLRMYYLALALAVRSLSSSKAACALVSGGRSKRCARIS